MSDEKTDAREVTLLMQGMEMAKNLLEAWMRGGDALDRLSKETRQWLAQEWQLAVARNGFAPTVGGPFCPRANKDAADWGIAPRLSPGRENPGVTLHVWTTAGDEPHLSNYFVVLGGVVIASNLAYRVGQLYGETDLDMFSVMKHPCVKAGDNVYPEHVVFDLRYWLPRNVTA